MERRRRLEDDGGLDGSEQPRRGRQHAVGLSDRASGQFFALDTATGDVLWLGSPREAANPAVVKAGEWLLLLNDDAELIVARASRRRFEPIVRYTVGDCATWAPPAISGQRLFKRDVTSLTLRTF